MGTPQSEVKEITPFLSDTAQVENMVLYLQYMKQFYDLDRSIHNVWNERKYVL